MQVNDGCPVLIFEGADVKGKGMISCTFEKLKDNTIHYKQCFLQFSIIIEIFVLHLRMGGEIFLISVSTIETILDKL